MKKFLLFVALTIVSCVPVATSAFVFEDSRVLKLNDTTALFSISYSARFVDRVTYHPLQATVASTKADVSAAHVEIFGATEPVTVFGFVESEAPVITRKYRLPTNSKGVQTVHVLVSVSDPSELNAISVGLQQIPINAVIPGEKSEIFFLRGAVVEQAQTETVAESLQ